jgi:hypothetical protein
MTSAVVQGGRVVQLTTDSSSSSGCAPRAFLIFDMEVNIWKEEVERT